MRIALATGDGAAGERLPGRARSRAGAPRALGDGVGETRRAYLDGLLAQLAGDEGAAREAYRRAYEIAAGENDLHTVAAVALNLGGLLIEEGLYGEALTASARAVRELGRLGATAELVPALVNAANLFVELGDLAAARRALDRALGLGAEGRASRARATASFVEGDLARRRGEIDAAVRHYRRSAGLFNDVGQPSGAASASLAIAETLAGAGRLADAKRALAGGGAAAGSAHRSRPTIRSSPVRVPSCSWPRGALAAAKRRPRSPSGSTGWPTRPQARARRPTAWRLAALAGRLAARAGAAAEARAAFDFGRTVFEEVRMATPEHHRAALESHPDAAWLSPEGVAGQGGAPARAPRPQSRGCGDSCASTSGSTASCGCRASWRWSSTRSSS